VEVLPLGAVLIKNFLSQDKQKELYKKEICIPSEKNRKILEDSNAKPWWYNIISAKQLAAWKNIFTQESNIPEPVEMLKLANDAISLAKETIATHYSHEVKPDELKIPKEININNLYAHIYPANGTAKAHVDFHLNWVVSISIGSTCDFAWGEQQGTQPFTTKLNSGDVIILNAGRLYHAVVKIYPESAPDFWKSGEVETFGGARCNIQLRDTTSLDPNCPPIPKEAY